jgi:hypothetical protein
VLSLTITASARFVELNASAIIVPRLVYKKILKKENTAKVDGVMPCAIYFVNPIYVTNVAVVSICCRTTKIVNNIKWL